MKVEFFPSNPSGTVKAPPSKSMAHRYLICSALANGKSCIEGLEESEDILATIDCLRTLGATITKRQNVTCVEGIDLKKQAEHLTLFCRESGSTLRFLIPFALSQQKEIVFCGSKRLMQRPQSVFSQLCFENKWEFSQKEDTITVNGDLKAGTYRLPGDISSQFISGLLFVLPLFEQDSEIVIEGPVESKSYIDMTIKAMEDFGVHAVWKTESTLQIMGNQRYCNHDVQVEGDYSNAAFLSALNEVGGKVNVIGLKADTLQGDAVYFHHFQTLKEKEPYISLAQCPDLGPILFALAVAQNGAHFTNIKRLTMKESDRVLVMMEELSKFGATFERSEDELKIFSKGLCTPTQPLFGHNDHRVVMALSVLLSKTGGVIEGAQAISKSYPAFFSDLKKVKVNFFKYENK